MHFPLNHEPDYKAQPFTGMILFDPENNPSTSYLPCYKRRLEKVKLLEVPSQQVAKLRFDARGSPEPGVYTISIFYLLTCTDYPGARMSPSSRDQVDLQGTRCRIFLDGFVC